MIRISIFFCLLSPLAFAQGVIHKCVDEDGNIAYQDSPCPEPKVAEAPADSASQELESTVDGTQDAEPEDVVSYEPVASNRSADEVEACKEPHRDSIDAIEAEMLRGYSAEQGETFKQELRTLTQAMRACE